MKAIDRRLRHLENRFGLAPKTEADRLLAARMEAANRRMTEMGYEPHRPLPRFGVPPGRRITVVEILHAGRQRAALSRVESNSQESTQQTPSPVLVHRTFALSPTKQQDHVSNWHERHGYNFEG